MPQSDSLQEQTSTKEISEATFCLQILAPFSPPWHLKKQSSEGIAWGIFWGWWNCPVSWLWWWVRASIHVYMCLYSQKCYTFHPLRRQFYCMTIKNTTRQNKTSGLTGRVLYLTPFTKVQKFHLASHLPRSLTHSFSRPHGELSGDETPPGSGNSSGNRKAMAFAFKEFRVGCGKPA